MPAIDTAAFPDFPKSGWFWISDLAAWSSASAWFVGFSDGSVLNYHRDSSGFTLAVRRAGQVSTCARWRDMADWHISRNDSEPEVNDEAYQFACDQAAAELAASLRNDPAACREAEQWTAGTFDGDHYTDVTLALHQLHHTHPDDLVGTELLTQLYRLAAVEAEALDAQLVKMARIAIAEQQVAA